MDRVGAFFKERCAFEPGAYVRNTKLYAEYSEWAEDAGMHPLSKPRFYEKVLEARGLTQGSRDGYTVFVGVRLPEGGAM
jgi:phage/plasmid-associated DNA primase